MSTGMALGVFIKHAHFYDSNNFSSALAYPGSRFFYCFLYHSVDVSRKHLMDINPQLIVLVYELSITHKMRMKNTFRRKCSETETDSCTSFQKQQA